MQQDMYEYKKFMLLLNEIEIQLGIYLNWYQNERKNFSNKKHVSIFLSVSCENQSPAKFVDHHSQVVEALSQVIPANVMYEIL